MIRLEERYKNHEIPRSILPKIVDDKVVVLNMEDNCDELEDIQTKNRRQIIYNRILQKVLSSERDLLKMDEEYLKEIDSLLSSTISMIDELYPLVDSNNFLEIARFMDFILVLYSDNYNVIGAKRRALKFHKKGIDFMDNRYDDTREEIDEFFKQELSKFKKEKMLEKQKKI